MTLAPGYVARSARMEDSKSLESLFVAVDRAEGVQPDYFEPDVLTAWRRTDLDIDRDTVVVEAENSDIAGYGHVETRPPTDLVALGWVDPGHWGRGIGTFLVRSLEERARKRAAESELVERVVNVVSGADPAVHLILEREGYKAVRHFWLMQRELDDVIEPESPPAGIAIRNFAPTERKTAYNVLAAAFQEHWGDWPSYDEWTTENFGSPTHDPTMWWMAEAQGDVVGVLVGAVRGERGSVVDLGVLRDVRGQGIGRALLLTSFTDFKRRGFKFVGLGVDSENETGATALYEGVGMKKVRQFDFYAKEI